MADKTSRELTPADLRVLEPDVLGTLAILLHGCEQGEGPGPSSLGSPANWRGRRRSRPERDARAD